MKRYARVGLLIATTLGLALALWLFRSIGLKGVALAAHRMGWGGALAYFLYSLAIFALLGAAWLAAAPGEPVRRIGRFSWARLLRESVADLLPFSQIGGLVVGARALRAGGISSARVYASMIADMTTEMASQLLFTLFGLTAIGSLLLGAGASAAALRPAAIGATIGLVAIILLFILGQRRLLAFARRMTLRLLPGAAVAFDAVDAELGRIYTRRVNVVASFAFNLAGWIGSAAGAWILLRLIGAPLPFSWVLAIESLIFTVRSVAFAVPGAIGFQEAAYALIGPLFGLPAEIALAISVAKRARDLALGVPTLIVWQIIELRAALRR